MGLGFGNLFFWQSRYTRPWDFRGLSTYTGLPSVGGGYEECFAQEKVGVSEFVGFPPEIVRGRPVH